MSTIQNSRSPRPFYKRHSFWLAVISAIAAVAYAAGVPVPPALMAAGQMIVGLVVADGDDDADAGEDASTADEPSPPAPLPPDGRGEAEGRGEGPAPTEPTQ